MIFRASRWLLGRDFRRNLSINDVYDGGGVLLCFSFLFLFCFLHISLPSLPSFVIPVSWPVAIFYTAVPFVSQYTHMT